MEKHVTFAVVSIFWLLFAIIGFLVSYRFQERGIIRCCCILTAVCCYLAWLVTFLMQLNPLVGPKSDQKVILGMMTYWPNSFMHNEKDP
ncbi:V-type proton ATPase subunit e 1 [Drosophila eugracilis]|uniref:V-type proton ATPase subunit e 1 n=1 Tax=Drosophila eugracilis TaxID=29029 RepID=UPI0007E7FC18|nr:V-type proton ATPase subunit e 1 [Drosophila eugracilis]